MAPLSDTQKWLRKNLSAKAMGADGWMMEVDEFDNLKLWGKVGTGLDTPEDVARHIHAEAHRGSPMHRTAMRGIERFDPELYAALRHDDLLTAMVELRQEEKAHYKDADIATRFRAYCAHAPKAAQAFMDAWKGVSDELNERFARYGDAKVFEVHHANMIALECFHTAALETKSPEDAAAATRRRMLLGTTPMELLGDRLKNPAVEADCPAP